MDLITACILRTFIVVCVASHDSASMHLKKFPTMPSLSLPVGSPCSELGGLCATVVPRPARLSLTADHHPPALVGEVYQLEVTLLCDDRGSEVTELVLEVGLVGADEETAKNSEWKGRHWVVKELCRSRLGVISLMSLICLVALFVVDNVRNWCLVTHRSCLRPFIYFYYLWKLQVAPVCFLVVTFPVLKQNLPHCLFLS